MYVKSVSLLSPKKIWHLHWHCLAFQWHSVHVPRHMKSERGSIPYLERWTSSILTPSPVPSGSLATTLDSCSLIMSSCSTAVHKRGEFRMLDICSTTEEARCAREGGKLGEVRTFRQLAEKRKKTKHRQWQNSYVNQEKGESRTYSSCPWIAHWTPPQFQLWRLSRLLVL